MPNSKPVPRKKSRQKRLNVTSREKWKHVLKSVVKEEVPINLLDSITINLTDGTSVDIDIKELLGNGVKQDVIEEYLNDKLEQLDHIIENVDFYVSADEVAKLVQPMTDLFLKDL